VQYQNNLNEIFIVQSVSTNSVSLKKKLNGGDKQNKRLLFTRSVHGCSLKHTMKQTL